MSPNDTTDDTTATLTSAVLKTSLATGQGPLPARTGYTEGPDGTPGDTVSPLDSVPVEHLHALASAAVAFVTGKHLDGRPYRGGDLSDAVREAGL